jgi:hypothetical protein
MKPFMVAAYRSNEIQHCGFRNAVPNGYPREYYVWGPIEERGGGLHNPVGHLSVSFCDTEAEALAHAQTLAIKNPGVSYLVAKTANVFTCAIPENLPITHAKFSEKGLLPA